MHTVCITDNKMINKKKEIKMQLPGIKIQTHNHTFPIVFGAHDSELKRHNNHKISSTEFQLLTTYIWQENHVITGN